MTPGQNESTRAPVVQRPASTGTAGPDGADVLGELRRAAAVRRAARERMADINAEHPHPSPERSEIRHAYDVAAARWSQLIRDAVAAGHPKADVARAAGCAAPSLYRHLTGGASTSEGRQHSLRGGRTAG